MIIEHIVRLEGWLRASYRDSHLFDSIILPTYDDITIHVYVVSDHYNLTEIFVPDNTRGLYIDNCLKLRFKLSDLPPTMEVLNCWALNIIDIDDYEKYEHIQIMLNYNIETLPKK